MNRQLCCNYWTGLSAARLTKETLQGPRRQLTQRHMAAKSCSTPLDECAFTNSYPARGQMITICLGNDYDDDANNNNDKSHDHNNDDGESIICDNDANDRNDGYDGCVIGVGKNDNECCHSGWDDWVKKLTAGTDTFR